MQLHTLLPRARRGLESRWRALREVPPRHWLGALDMLPVVAATFIFALVYQADSVREPMAAMPWLIALLALASLRVPRALGAVEPPASLAVRAAGLVVWFMVPHLVADEPYQRMLIYPNHELGMQGVLALVKLAALWLVLMPPKPRVALGVLVTGALAIRGFGFGVWEVHPGARDMLPLTLSASDALLAGENPYGVHPMQIGSQIPLTYPPLLWLSYLPTVLLDIDVRWTNWVADAVVALGLGLAAMARSARLGPWVLVGLAGYLFVPDVHWNGIYAEANVDWAVLALLLAAVLSGRWQWIGLAYGAALLTRPFNVVMLPLLLIWLVYRFGLRGALRTMLVAGTLAAMVYLPFVLRDPDAFFLGTVHWLLEYGAVHETWFHDMLSFSGPLYEADREDWLMRGQLLVVAATTLLGLWRARTTHGFLMVATWLYAGFVAFNSLIWMSFWISVALLAVATAVCGHDPEPAPVRVRFSDGPRWLRNAELALAAGVLVAGGVLGYHLRAYFDTDGRDALAEHLAAEVQPGDLVLDLSGPRLAFLKTPNILDPLPPGAELAHHELATGVGPRRRALEPGAAERVWVVDRYGESRRDPLLEDSRGDGGFYREVEQLDFGRFELRLLERRAEAPLLDLEREPSLWRARMVPQYGGRTTEGEAVAGATPEVRFRGFAPWTAVRRMSCRIRGLSRPMLSAHPVNRHRLEVEAEVPQGARWAVLSGGLEDGVVEWRRHDVDVRLEVDGEVVREVVFENAIGLRSVAIPLNDDADRVTVGVSVGDDGRRQFCMDLVFWR